MKTDLITGFLGAGKTTFILKYREFCRSLGEKLQVIENEFCGYDVDSQILSEHGSRPISLAGECMCCTGKEHFKELLLLCAKEGYDRVLVEPSGIYDVGEFFSVLDSEKVRNCCEIGNIIPIFDPAFANDLTPESEELMVSQLLVSGMIVVSKTALYQEEMLAGSRAALEQLLGEYGIRENIETGECDIPICTKDWEMLEDPDFHTFITCGYRRSSHQSPHMQHSQIFNNVLIKGRFTDEKSFRGKLDRLFCTGDYGEALRLKGYVKGEDGQTYLVNAAPGHYDIGQCEKKRGILVLIGIRLNETAVKQLLG